ncbi:hypothetical protein DM01DRAFT_1338689 [Hesseltinella vesiculosa]|uniref:Protein PNS1 n=1 Tax=Hesseltinella vesiculosa TaxID=101127 RepID=A0A1X2G969_9FUNG|nr:hypothetical protein DM01DRAFT_1338689 [Hesseltinella vesiculosa]
MEAESENEDDDNFYHEHATTQSLFYSTQQLGDESIPLEESYGHYSDRSQLIFSQDDMLREDNSTYEESPKPSAIYLDLPSPENFPSQAAKQLSESLLPTTAAIPSVISSKTEKKYRDPVFMALYILCFGFYLASGLVILFTTSEKSIEKLARGTTFATIKESAGLLTLMMALAIISGSVWIYVLRKMTKVIVWGTLFVVPASFVGMFIWSFSESLHKHSFGTGEFSQNKSLTVLSMIPLVISAMYSFLVYINRHKINKTITIIELSCDVMRFNPGIAIVSLILLAVFIVFTTLWITLFNRLWLMGLTSGSNWIVSSNAYLWAVFHIFVYFWTAAILINMQRFALSAITAQWYFHRLDPQRMDTKQSWKIALYNASTTSFGTLAFGGLILSLVQLLHFLTRHMKKYTRSNWPLTSLVSAILTYVEALISNINNYVIGLAGITGDSFCASAKAGTKIFRRNLISGLVGDLITRLVLYIGSLVVSIASGLAAYVFASHQLHSSHGYVLGFMASLAPLYISQFFSYTLMSIVDATFLCYAIDLDTGTVHLTAAHDVFSGFD